HCWQEILRLQHHYHDTAAIWLVSTSAFAPCFHRPSSILLASSFLDPPSFPRQPAGASAMLSESESRFIECFSPPPDEVSFRTLPHPIPHPVASPRTSKRLVKRSKSRVRVRDETGTTTTTTTTTSNSSTGSLNLRRTKSNTSLSTGVVPIPIAIPPLPTQSISISSSDSESELARILSALDALDTTHIIDGDAILRRFEADLAAYDHDIGRESTLLLVKKI
ncbi:hypothetical protein C8F01DRAFT_1276399, partial [Mycena amicta]